MNIVMLVRLYKPHVGGVEKHVEKLIQECIKDGNNVTVFTTRHSDHLPTVEEADRYTIYRIPILTSNEIKRSKMMERIGIWFFLLFRLQVFLRADIVHVHDVFFWYWPLRFILFWKKVFITFHGFEAGKLPTQKAKQARQLAEIWTNGNIAIGEWIQKWYGTHADIVLYGAADCTSNERVVSLQKSKKDKVQAVFIGRLSEDTGIAQYVDAIVSLSTYELDIYGEGDLENWIRSKKEKHVHLKGEVQDACTVFPQYDLACVSSYLSILEAMQSHTYVVAYAADDLKYDYLICHPAAKHMTIVRSKKELNEFLTSFKKGTYTESVERAYSWAKKQTWKSVFQQYKKLWKEPS